LDTKKKVAKKKIAKKKIAKIPKSVRKTARRKMPIEWKKIKNSRRIEYYMAGLFIGISARTFYEMFVATRHMKFDLDDEFRSFDEVSQALSDAADFLEKQRGDDPQNGEE
jgi:hypothetical protein